MAGGYGLAGQIDTYLKQKGSPLAGLGNVFVASGKKYGIDPRLVVGIAGAESTFGKYLLSPNNAWNWSPGKPFSSWQEGINTVTQGMAYYRDHYKAATPAEIVTHYAPSSDGNDESVWTGNVSSFMRELGATPASTVTKTVVTPTPTLITKPPALKAVPLSKAATAVGTSAATAAQAFKLPALPTFQPSDSGLRGALISNLMQTAQYGHAPSGASLLGGLLQGQLQDQASNDAAQQQLDEYTAAIKAAIPPPSSVVTPPPTTPATPAAPPLLKVPPPTPTPPPTDTPDPNATMPPDKVRYWAKFAPGADRSGMHTVPAVFDIVAKIAQAHGSPLTITTGTNHNQYVAGENHVQSAHWTGHAADILYGHGTGSDNIDPALTKLGQTALIVAGMPPAEALKQQGGWFNVGNFNILFNTYVGGNHYNHLHVGLRS